MFGSAMVRRSVGWILSIVLAVYGTHYMEYHPALRSTLLTAKTFEVFALSVLTIIVLVWATLKHSSFGTIVAFLAGLLTAIYGQSLFQGNIAFLGIMIFGSGILYVLTVATDLTFVAPARVAVRRRVTNP